MARYEVVSSPNMRSLMNWSKERLARTLMDFFRASDAVRDVMAERGRQVTGEGWTPAHDDDHGHGEMAMAAACYAAHGALGWFANTQPPGGPQLLWPWAPGWWKPKDRRRDLVRAGALIIAEIERIDRMREKGAGDE